MWFVFDEEVQSNQVTALVWYYVFGLSLTDKRYVTISTKLPLPMVTMAFIHAYVNSNDGFSENCVACNCYTKYVTISKKNDTTYGHNFVYFPLYIHIGTQTISIEL